MKYNKTDIKDYITYFIQKKKKKITEHTFKNPIKTNKQTFNESVTQGRCHNSITWLGLLFNPLQLL